MCLETSDKISLVQLGVTLLGGIIAYFLLRQSNREKRQALIATLYDKFYNDEELRKFLYALDKVNGIEGITSGGPLEKPADKMLRYLDFIGLLTQNDPLLWENITSLFRYEINLATENENVVANQAMQDYITRLAGFGITFPHIDNLKKKPAGLIASVRRLL